MPRRAFVTVCVAVGLLFLLSSCRNEASKPGEESVIIIGTTDSITVLDPEEGNDPHTGEILRNTLDGLLKFKPGTTELAPALALELPSVSPDGKEWTFKLRRDAVFSDGTPFNAEVVKYSIDRALGIEADNAWLVSIYVDSIEIVDEYTVKFILKGPYAFFPSLVTSVPYLPVNPNTYEKDTLMTDDISKLASIGPYRIDKVVRDQEIVLVRNESYYGEPAKTGKVIIKYYKDATTMRLALENGEIDVAWRSLNPVDIISLKSKEGIRVTESESAYIRYICFVSDRPPFNDKKLRQAFAYAINRGPIVDKVFMDLVSPLYSMVPVGLWSHKDSFKDAPDTTRSREILEGLGYSSEKPLSFELWYTPFRYGSTEADMALLIKQQLEATGVMTVELKSAEYGTYNDNYDRGNMDAFFKGWTPDYFDPDNYTAAFALSESSMAMGLRYSNPTMDDLLTKGKMALDQGERENIYEEIQRYWAEEVPTVPLLQNKVFMVTRSDIHGVEISPALILYYDTIYRK